MPEVTIALLTYNRSGLLKQAIEGALAQTFRDFELLVVDNASTDDTGEMLRSIHDPRLVHIRRSVNGGPIANNAEALARAQGRLLLIAHDDDIMHPTMVERQRQALMEHPDAILVATNVQPIDLHGQKLERALYPACEDRVFPKGGFVKTWLEDGFWLPAPTCMLRMEGLVPRQRVARQWVRPETEGNNPFGITGDTLSSCRMNQLGSLVFLGDPLLSYRVHPEQSTFQDDPVSPQVPFFKCLTDLCRRHDASRPHLPTVEAALLRYQAQTLLLGVPQSPHQLLKKFTTLEWHCLKRNRLAPSDEYLQFALLMHLLGGHSKLIEIEADGGTQDLSSSSEFKSGYRRWLKLLRHKRRHLASSWLEQGVRRVAIMGSLLHGALIAMDCQRAGIEVSGFLDSNRCRAGQELLSLPIHSIESVQAFLDANDRIIFSSERKSEASLRNYLSALVQSKDLHRCIGWQSGLEGAMGL